MSEGFVLESGKELIGLNTKDAVKISVFVPENPLPPPASDFEGDELDLANIPIIDQRYPSLDIARVDKQITDFFSK